MLTLHPRLVAAADDEAEDSRLCYCVVVACVSLLLFIVLTAAVSIARAGAIAGAVVLLLGLVSWLAPTGTTESGGPAMRHQAPAAAPVRQVRYRCACGLADAAIGALPTFAYEPPAAAKGGDDGSGKPPRGSSVLCAVCLEDVQAGEVMRQLPACGHLFHVGCVDAWLRSHRTCPLCRRELSPPLNFTAKAPAAAAVDTESSSVDVLPPV